MCIRDRSLPARPLQAGPFQGRRFDLRNNYAICLWRLGKLDEAIATIKRAAADNQTTLVYTTLGLFLIPVSYTHLRESPR